MSTFGAFWAYREEMCPSCPMFGKKLGNGKAKSCVYAQIRKKRGKETEKLGSRERKNLYMPNFAENIFLKQITS